MTKKDNTPTIILELTPREAAAIYTMAWTANWDKGNYGAECREIAEALEDVCHKFPNICAYMSDESGIVRGGSFWFIDEANDDENLHSYSGA